MSQGRQQTSYQESADLNSYARIEGKDTFKIFQDITIVEKGFMRTLSTSAAKLAIQIMDELKMNNALWHHKVANKKQYEHINALIQAGLLRKTEDPYIFLVSPMFMRRGTVHAVLAHTASVLRDTPKVNKDMIRDIKYSEPIKFSQYDILVINPG